MVLIIILSDNLLTRWCLCRIAVTQQVPLVEQNCLPFQNTWVHPRFIAQYLVFCLVFCTSLFVILSFFFVLSVLLWFTSSDYPFSIFNFLAHLAFRPCELLLSLFVRRPSVNISHFNLLLRNHWANCNQTLVEWSLDGPLSKVCPVIPTYNQDGHQAKNRKKGGWNFNCPLLL